MIPKLSKNFVDTHFHVFTAGDGLSQARYRPGYDASLQAWQHVSQPLGVGYGVLVQTSFMGTDNSRLVAELAIQPQCLRGVAVVAPDADRVDLQRLHAAGVRGIRLNLAGVSHEIPEWRRADPIWSTLAELGWHLELHTDIGALPGVLQQLPGDLALVLDHMAKPDALTKSDPTVQAILQRHRKASVHIKLSGAYRLGGRPPKQTARMWLDLLGVDRLLWGSDWPHTNHEGVATYATLLDQLQDWVGEDAFNPVLMDNPLALYWRT